jgi:hypothetical protein
MFGLADLLLRQIRVGEEEAARIYEAVIGVVTGIDDPLRLCRVRVQFPWLSSRDDAWWATVVSPGAGKDRGWFSLPEVGDEVLCVFEHGEIHRPVIIGQLWNGQDKSIDKNDGANERRVISSKSGSRLVFDDQERELTVSDGGGIGSVKLSEDGVVLTASQGDAGAKASGGLDVYAGEIQIKGTTVVLSGTSGVNATAAAALKITGNVVALKGSTIDVNPGGVPSAAKCSGTVTSVGEDPGAGGGTSGGGGGGGGGPGGGGGGPGRGTQPGGGSGPGRGTQPGGGGNEPDPSSNSAPGNQPVDERPPLEVHAIEIAVVNALDQPAVGVFYQLVQPDGRTRTGTTDGAGMIKIDDIEQPGDCQLTFPDVDRQAPADDPPPAAT